MSFEEFAKRTAGSDEHIAHVRERKLAGERKPWHEAFLADVYPSWQGVMTAMSRKPGIERVTHGASPDFPGAANASEFQHQLPPRDWVLAELITVAGAVGVAAVIAYVFAGDENDGTAARVEGVRDAGVLTLVGTPVVWSGPRARVMEGVLEDQQVAAGEMGRLLLAALDAREARLAAEKAAAAEAERVQLAAEERRKAEAEAAKKAEIERQAAAERARRDEEDEQTDDA